MNRPDDELDNLFRNHFAAELDPMRGQAVRAFDREVIRPMRRRVRLDSFAFVGRRLKQAAPVLLSMAACTALGFYVPRWLSTPAATTEIADVSPSGDVPDATLRPWQTQIESVHLVDPKTNARTEFYLFPGSPDATTAPARQ